MQNCEIPTVLFFLLSPDYERNGTSPACKTLYIRMALASAGIFFMFVFINYKDGKNTAEKTDPAPADEIKQKTEMNGDEL